MTTNELLSRYVADQSEPAFAELVRQNIDLVYSAALRQVNDDATAAQDVAQAVFTELARQAPQLLRHTSLTGWLYTSTRYLASKVRRAEQRRHAREQEAHAMNQLLYSDDSDSAWLELRPLLDEAMHELSAPDREVVLLRFFERLPLVEVGAQLKLTENAARMRVERALLKLRAALAKRGVTSSAIALGSVLAQRAVASAPAGLATRVSKTAIAAVAAGGGLGWGLLTLAGWIRGKLLVAAGATAVVAGLLVVPQWLDQNSRTTTASAPTPQEEAGNTVVNAVNPASVNSATTGKKRALRILTADTGEPTPSARGLVHFSTVSLGTKARVYDTNGTPASGAAFKAQLYAAPGEVAESALVAAGNPVGFRANMNAGYVQISGLAFGKPVNPIVTVTTSVAGGPVTVQLRAWDAAYSTHEAALAANAQHGESDLLALGGTGIPPSIAPVSLIGLPGFKMVVSDSAQNPLPGKDPNRLPIIHLPAPPAPDEQAVLESMRQPAGEIRGIPVDEYRSALARRILRSRAINTAEGQQLMLLLLENGYNVEHYDEVCLTVYRYHRVNSTNNLALTGDPERDASKIERARNATRNMLARELGGRPESIDPKVIDALLSVKLSRPLSTTISLEDLENDTRPVERRWFTSKDVIDYINAHPAAPGNATSSPTLAGRTELDGKDPVTGSNQEPYIRPRAQTQSGMPNQTEERPERFCGTPIKIERPRQTLTFLKLSQAKDTVEGQAIARLLLENGYGPEFIATVYSQLYFMTASINSTPATNEANLNAIETTNKDAFKRLLRLSELNPKAPPMTTNLAERLMAIRPTAQYIKPGTSIALASGPAYDPYLDAQDILDYLKAHPAIPHNAASSLAPLQQ